LKTLVFATHNPNKLQEVRRMLPANLQLKSLPDIGCSEAIPETGNTLKANARIKANYIADHYGMDCFADDTGLEVDALGGAPGVYSARYAGADADAEKNMEKLLRAMDGQLLRTARFRTVIALIMAGTIRYFEGTVEGTIALEPIGTGGFGYDPIFLPKGSTRSFAQYSPQEKNAISHRGKAFEALCGFLADLPGQILG
jgi:XTP/dITP diphosphohydrolase